MARDSGIAGPLLVLGLTAYTIGGVAGKLPFPNFEGGESDPAPRGAVYYNGQTARTVSDTFPFVLGTGEAIVAAQMHQDYDKPGSFLNGDFENVNGTGFVRDPESHGPANITVDLLYCATGHVEVEKTGSGSRAQTTAATFIVGEMFVCKANLANTPYNQSAIYPEDLPQTFQGDFKAFAQGAIEATAMAAPCPTDELANYQDTDFMAHAQRVWAGKLGIDMSLVNVEVGTPGVTDDATQAYLQRRLDSYTNVVDPDDHTKTYPGLEISFLGTNGDAVGDSCYLDLRGIELSSIDGLSSFDVFNE